ncbi:unnamed protein product, partial [Prorocentrum cordatum]
MANAAHAAGSALQEKEDKKKAKEETKLLKAAAAKAKASPAPKGKAKAKAKGKAAAPVPKTSLPVKKSIGKHATYGKVDFSDLLKVADCEGRTENQYPSRAYSTAKARAAKVYTVDQ